MRIAWISHVSYWIAGAEIAFLEALRGLVDSKVECHVIVPRLSVLTERIEDLGIPVSLMRYTSWMSHGDERSAIDALRRGGRNLLAIWPVVSKLKQIQPDLVVTNTLTTPIGAIASRLAGIPHVWSLHELFGKDANNNLFFDLGPAISIDIIDRLSQRIVVNSTAMKQIFMQWIRADKIEVVYQGVEVPSSVENGHLATPLTVSLVGSKVAGKRQADAIRALSLLSQRGLSVRLVLVGNEDPKYAAYLKQLANDLKVANRLDSICFVESPFSYVAASDVALMCSTGEAFGRVTIEAMKLGKPVVGANSGGTAELIHHGVNGFLYEMGNVEDLAQKIEILYHDRKLLRRLGDQAREWSNRTFTVREYTARLMEVFRDVVSDTRVQVWPRMSED